MLKIKLENTPTKPGCYIMYNSFGHVIYVGKAKNLKNRLSSYFNTIHNYKTQILVNEINTFETIITKTELEALILESNLIKKHRPKYNILLKDDKSYPYIELVTKDGPMLKIVRNKAQLKDSPNLFGPFPNVTAARETVNILNRVYPLRKCNPLKKDYCLYYHLGQCLGYCKEEISQDLTTTMIEEISNFLNSQDESLILKLEEKMKEASAKKDYEEAIELREMISNLKITLAKQIIQFDAKEDFDLFASYLKNNYLSIVVFHVRKGKLFASKNDVIPLYTEETDTLSQYLIAYYEKEKLPKKLLVSSKLDPKLLSEYLKIKVLSPQRGKFKAFFELAIENAKLKLEEEEAKIKKTDDDKEAALNSLKKIFKKEIKRIEAFDNSHLFGTYYVAGMVVFDYLEANKSLYRKYKLNLDTPDDLKAFEEVLYRRYHRALMEEEELCDLLIVDGGETQVKTAKKVLSSLNLEIPILGLKKDLKHKTKELIDENLEKINLDDNRLFIYLSKIQEEAHRFAITYHRNIKSKGMLNSFLDLVPGIGEKRKLIILKAFPSFKKLQEASCEDLEKILDKKTAKVLAEHLKEME